MFVVPAATCGQVGICTIYIFIALLSIITCAFTAYGVAEIFHYDVIETYLRVNYKSYLLTLYSSPIIIKRTARSVFSVHGHVASTRRERNHVAAAACLNAHSALMTLSEFI